MKINSTLYDLSEYPFWEAVGIEDEDIVNSLLYLLENRFALSNEERQTIIKIANRI
jgi:hypothetical protein